MTLFGTDEWPLVFLRCNAWPIFRTAVDIDPFKSIESEGSRLLPRKGLAIRFHRYTLALKAVFLVSPGWPSKSTGAADQKTYRAY